MDQKRDFYDLLGITRDASLDEIKKSYRKLAKQYHPDLNPNDKEAENKFKEIQEAYETLSDDEKRKMYDMFGSSGVQPGARGNAWGDREGFSRVEFGFGDFMGFESLFDDIFSRAGAGRRGGPFRRRGRDVQYVLEIDFETSIEGGTRDITISKQGPGRQTDVERISVKIPPGVDTGSRIRVAGKGQPGTGGGPPGDLYLEIEFAPHPFYRVEGQDIYLNLPVAPWEAALGYRVKTPTPMGTVDLKLPTGAKSGQKLRLKGRGIPAKKPGDIYVILQLVTPVAKTDAMKALYKKMEKELKFNPRSQLGV